MPETSWTVVAEESCATDMMTSGDYSGRVGSLREQEERDWTAVVGHQLRIRMAKQE